MAILIGEFLVDLGVVLAVLRLSAQRLRAKSSFSTRKAEIAVPFISTLLQQGSGGPTAGFVKTVPPIEQGDFLTRQLLIWNVWPPIKCSVLHQLKGLLTALFAQTWHRHRGR